MKPGRKEKLKPRQVTWARARWRGGLSLKELCWALQIDRSTLQGYAKRHGFGPHPHAHIGKLLVTKPEPPRQDSPTCFVCGGSSATWDGHDRCRGRTPVHEEHGRAA